HGTLVQSKKWSRLTFFATPTIPLLPCVAVTPVIFWLIRSSSPSVLMKPTINLLLSSILILLICCPVRYNGFLILFPHRHFDILRVRCVLAQGRRAAPISLRDCSRPARCH